MTEIKGKGVPTNKTKGALGVIYTDTDTGVSYKCTGAYGINGVENYEWKRISEPETEKIPVGKTEENKVETTETSFEQFMNPPVDTEAVEETAKEPVTTRDESVMEGAKPYNKHNYGKYHNKNKNHRN